MIRIGVLTVSDRASRGEYPDKGGPAILEFLKDVLTCAWEPHALVIPDEQEHIEATLKAMCDDEGCCFVVTTGGTGPARRDVTPEATEAVCEKMLPGFGELMRAVSLKSVPTAILSRQTAGIRGRSLIVNLPGKPSAIRECLLAVMPAVPYCVDLIGGPYLTTNETVVKAFRPGQ
ncbi:molybdopterin adenylyltransferase [Gemmata sp. JC717]|uniref:molybdopterin adenylyltransferase n=1 Tax=Gemmata algarum TaxID=2975278 RepID=UPI0021BA794F|nr:molybdopterin adenylyltransferase [Gemmata algarum]MDY3555573.1 molybdopterin adenylyltransferase [Gemmata algarum]